MIILLILILVYFIFGDRIRFSSTNSVLNLPTNELQIEDMENTEDNSDDVSPSVTMHDNYAEVTNNGETKKLSRTCPHAGCNVNYDNTQQKFVCPCHGAKFDLDGTVLRGPATDNLAPY